jgi:hypothetical protein
VGQAVGNGQRNPAERRLVEQSSAASASLEEQARRLTEIVSIFQLPTANEPPQFSHYRHRCRKDTPVAVNTHASVTSDNWETFLTPDNSGILSFPFCQP